ncbi:MAG: hypothetical protein HRU25_10105 [Psychrobium sp.]|nr:hypothetical protein [Psychrobium sp.]
MNQQSQVKDQVAPKVAPANKDNLSGGEVKMNSVKVPAGYIDCYQCIDSDGVTASYVLGYN